MKHFKNFNSFISDNTIYHTVYEGKDVFIMGNTLYYDNQQLVLNYTPIYDSVSKRFIMLNEDISSDENSILSGIGNFLVDQIIPPSISKLSTVDGMIEWGHWLTGSASLLSMIVGLGGAIFTGGTSILAGAGAAKLIDMVDISLYVIEITKHLLEGDYLKAGTALVLGGISAILLPTTPEGNSVFISFLGKNLKKLAGKIKPKSLAEGAEYILEQPAVKKKFGKGIIELFKALDTMMIQLGGWWYKAARWFLSSTYKVLKGIGKFFMNLYDMCKNGISKIKEALKHKSVDLSIPTNSLKNYNALKSVFGKNPDDKLRLLGDIVENPNAQKKLGGVFDNIFKKLSKDNKNLLYNMDIDVNKLGVFSNNIEHMSDDMLDGLSDVFANKGMLGKIGDFSADELALLSKQSKNKELLDFIGKEVDVSQAKKYIQWSSHITNPESIEALKKISPELLDSLVENGGDFMKTLSSPIYKSFKEASQSSILTALYNNVQKGFTVNYKKIDVSNFADGSVVGFGKKVYEKGGSIVFDGKRFKSFDAFEKYAKSIDLATKSFNTFTRIFNRNAVVNTGHAIVDYKRGTDDISKAVCPPNDKTTMLIEYENMVADDATEYIKIKPASERTPEQSNLIKEYLKYIIEASEIIKNQVRFDQATQDKTLPKDKESYDLSVEANYVNGAKLFQGYINNFLADDKKLTIDGKIGEKTLNAAYKFFNDVTAKDKDGKTIKTGTERANKTKELLEKLKPS